MFIAILLLLFAGFTVLIIRRHLVKYTLRRLLGSLLTLFIIITVVFVLLRNMPEEGFIENYDKLSKQQRQYQLQKLGITDPIHIQLWNFFKQLFRGDLGRTTRIEAGRYVTDIIINRMPLSALLGLLSMVLSLVMGVPLGAAMARKKGKFWDKFGTAFIVFINAVPAAVYYIFIYLYGTKWFGITLGFSRSNLVTWILPVFSMSLGSAASYAMWLRRYMVDEMNKDYIRLARAKGVPGRSLMFRHVFRNAFVPMIQYIPATLLYTVAGSLYIERLYGIPGMGGLLVNAIQQYDNPLVQALVMIYSCIGIVGLLMGDLLMALIDPRISFAKKDGVR